VERVVEVVVGLLGGKKLKVRDSDWEYRTQEVEFVEGKDIVPMWDCR